MNYKFFMDIYDNKEVEINDELKERIAQAVKEKILNDFDNVVYIDRYVESYPWHTNYHIKIAI